VKEENNGNVRKSRLLNGCPWTEQKKFFLHLHSFLPAPS